MTTVEYMHRLVFPAAYDLLPVHMASVEATAMLLAIGLQESRFQYRQQIGGPARGFFQFERGGGVAGVIRHVRTRAIITDLCEETFQISPTPRDCHEAITHNDILAACFARLLLWTLPGDLPGRADPGLAWSQYLASWRPGIPHRDTWDDFYAQAWEVVAAEEDS